MKRKLIFMLLVAMLAACTLPDGINDAQNQGPIRPDYLYIDFEEETRVEFNSDRKTIWSEGDKVIRFGTDIMDVWEYIGLTGEDTDCFEFVEELDITDNHDYEDRFYVLYSYDSYLGISFLPDGPEILHTIKATQNYTPNTYDPKSNIMIGESGSSEIFSLRNLMGYLHIPIKGTKTISKIVISGNNNEILNGKRSVLINNPDTCYWDTKDGKTITLECSKGVQLSSNKATDFYITLVPTIFTKGFSLDIYFTDETTQRLSTDSKMTIKRNKILPLQDITIVDKVEPEPEPEPEQVITIQHHGNEVYIPLLYGGKECESYAKWGDGYTSGTLPPFDGSNYYWVDWTYIYEDNKPSHTIKVIAKDAYEFYIKSCKGISEIDFSKF